MSNDAILLNRALQAITKELEARSKSMADGACRVSNDAAGTGVQYIYQAGTIYGLRLADKQIREAIQKLTKGEEE